MSSESTRALEMIGRHPQELRGAALAIMPIRISEELWAHGMIEYEDDKQIRCHLTLEGERLAEALSVAALTSRKAEKVLSEKFAEAKKELGSAQKLTF